MIYFQTVLGFSAVEAGGYAFIGNIPMLIPSSFAGILIDRYGSRLPLLMGFSLIFASLFCFFFILEHAHIELLLLFLVLWSLGMGMLPVSNAIFILQGVAKRIRSSATAMISTHKQLSASLGLALFGALYSFVYNQELQLKLSSHTATRSISLDHLEGILSYSPRTTEYLNQLSPQEASYVVEASKIASVHALESLTLVGALAVIIPLVIVYVFFKKK